MSKNKFGHKCEMKTQTVEVTIRKKLSATLNSEKNKLVLVIGLNPSKANDDRSDNTVTRLENYFCKKGYGKLILYNLFQNYSTKPIGICEYTATDFSEKCIQKDLHVADTIVLAYGKNKLYSEYIEDCKKNLIGLEEKCFCFSEVPNQEGSDVTLHPVRLTDTWELVKYKMK